MQAFLSSADFFSISTFSKKKPLSAKQFGSRSGFVRSYLDPCCLQSFISFFLSNISFECIKETSQGDISFAHPKHMFDIKDS